VSVWPTRRLPLALAVWTLAASSAALWPALWPALVGALAALGALVAWDASLLRRRPRVRAARMLPSRGFVGQAARIGLVLSNPGDSALRASAIDELPRDIALEEPRFEDVVVPAGAATTLEYAVRPRVRGDRTLGPLLVYEASPLGFLRRRAAFADGQVLRVYPDTARFLRSAALDPQRLLAALGHKPRRRRGDGMEFESLRDYVVGDDPRRLDWAASGRRGRPVVRVHQHESNHVVLIALDASRLMAARAGDRTKLDCAVEAALALALAGLTSRDRVGLAVFDRALRAWLSPRSSRSDLGAFVEALQPVQPRPVEADYGSLLGELAARQRQRALIVILTDFVEAESARLSAPLAVLGRRHRLMLVAVRDPIYAELEPQRSRTHAPFGLHRRLVLDDLLHEREEALTALRRRGVETLDLFPDAITAPLLNRYLAIRYGAER
jgi:uncharacterized protein (DUF58 family)